mmetsp:Transcript_42901/g.84969  ORF Transcript_42901/g.84969 Transcript_42901/m.84969 type:complete len:119 (-) Transcript_42901:1532-1888(-)
MVGYCVFFVLPATAARTSSSNNTLKQTQLRRAIYSRVSGAVCANAARRSRGIGKKQQVASNRREATCSSNGGSSMVMLLHPVLSCHDRQKQMLPRLLCSSRHVAVAASAAQPPLLQDQ